MNMVSMTGAWPSTSSIVKAWLEIFSRGKAQAGLNLAERIREFRREMEKSHEHVTIVLSAHIFEACHFRSYEAEVEFLKLSFALINFKP